VTVHPNVPGQRPRPKRRLSSTLWHRTSRSREGPDRASSAFFWPSIYPAGAECSPSGFTRAYGQRQTRLSYIAAQMSITVEAAQQRRPRQRRTSSSFDLNRTDETRSSVRLAHALRAETICARFRCDLSQPPRLQAWVNALAAKGLAPRTVAKALAEVTGGYRSPSSRAASRPMWRQTWHLRNVRTSSANG